MIAGRVDVIVHTVAQVLTVAVALRNVASAQGSQRWFGALGVVAWVTSAIVAMIHFG